MVSTVAEHANTSAASIPLALAEAVEDGRIKPGELLLLEAMGGGLTWAPRPAALAGRLSESLTPGEAFDLTPRFGGVHQYSDSG